MDQAQKANDDIAAAMARVREADAQLRIAGAALLPSIDAAGTAAREREFTAVTTPVTLNVYSAQLSAAYELDFWGKNRAIRESAAAALLANRYDRATIELSVMTSVANTYFAVLALQERVSIAESDLASAEKILRGLQLEQTVGTAAALDVAQQATLVATVNATIPPLRQQLRQNIDALAILIGKTPEELDITRGRLDDVNLPQVSPGLPSQLIARRPDVANAEAQLIGANADIREARAAFFPSIDLTASGGYESTALSKLLRPESHVFALGTGITQPLFHGGALAGQYAYSKARYAELLAAYHKAVISAFGNVEDALTSVRETAEQQQREQVAVDKANRAYSIAQMQLRAGTVNVLNVLNTETALFTAQDALAQVKLAHLTAVVSLFQALGGGWEQRLEYRACRSVPCG